MASADAQIRIAIKNLGALTKLTKTLDKLNVTTNKIVQQLEKMDAPSQQLKENLTKADKEANKLASGSLNKVNRELKEIEKTSQRATFSFGGLLTKLGALRGSLNKGLGGLFGKNFLGGLESGAGLRGISDILNKLNKTSFSNLARGLSDTAFSVTALGGALNAAKVALNFGSPVAAAVGQFITLERAAVKFTENTINRFRRMNTRIIADSLQSFKQLGILYDPRSALSMDIWKNFEDMKGGGFANMKGMQSRGKAALEGMFAPQIGRSWYGQTTFPNAFGSKELMSLFPAMQMGGFDVKTLTQYPNSLDLFPKEEGEYLKQLRENILLGKDINKENFRRKKVLEEVLKVENRIENQIRKNIALSKKSRQGSGFKDWNAYIERRGQALLSPVEKSIRRHGRKAGHGFTADQYGPQPLYGPAMAPETPLANRMSMLNRYGIGKNANPKGMFASRGGMGGRARGALSSGLIGGGFPLLFGQSGLASVLGGVGGAIGGALGGGLGFGLSIAGTAAAQKIQEVIDYRKAINNLNVAIKATGGTSTFTAREVSKFAKQLGMTKDEALTALSAFKAFDASARTALTSVIGSESVFKSLAGIKDYASTLQALPALSEELSLEETKRIVEAMKLNGLKGTELEITNQILEKNKKIMTEKGKAKGGLFNLESYNIFRGIGEFGLNKSENGRIIGGYSMEELAALRTEKNFEKFKQISLEKIKLQKEFNKLVADEALLNKANDDLIRLLDPVRQLVTAADAIGAAFSNSFQGIITGSMSAQQALANFFKQTAASFAQMAADILAAQIRAKIVGMFANSFKITGGATNTALSTTQQVGKDTALYNSLGSVNTFPAGSFASGGYVTRPTVGLVGEAGEDEYVIPASKMASSMQRYSAGARGDAVVAGTGSSYAGGGAGASTTVNYSGPILNFNSEEFVPKSAVGQIIATATSRGAKAGEARTLSSLQNSRSRRSNLGL